ncbi:MAG TPA: BTAD domain-containing putative transcriptional regulator [Candidatus Limnocylindrales bacterium]|nr:BTAD domain-containing putative transcriptional regulator [Candidatus Limnocylindrales bacterium]
MAEYRWPEGVTWDWRSACSVARRCAATVYRKHRRAVTKPWALLAYLVLSQSPVSRTRAAALLFPDAHDPLAALRWNLHQLRCLLGAEAGLCGDTITVRLAPTDVLDVAVVRSGSWRQAVLIADPDAELLQGLHFTGCPGFEAWLTAQRRHLRSVAEAVLHESVLARLAAGQIDQAVATASQLVAANPYDEELQELYVRCLLAAGDPVSAHRQRQAAIDLIRRDLGVEPQQGLLTVGQNTAADGVDDVDADEVSIKAWSKLGLVWLHAGAYDAALASMRRAITAARRRGDPDLLLRALLICGYGLGVSSLGGGAESMTVQHEAIALAAQLGNEPLLGMAELQYATTELLRGQYSRALHWAESAATRCADDPVKVSRVCTIRGTAIVDTGCYAEGIQELEKALSSAPVDAEPRKAAYALSMLGKAHLLLGDTTAAIAPLDQAIHLAQVHWIGFQPWPECLRAEAALRCGQIERADQMYRQAYALARNFEYSPCWESAAARGLGLVAAANGAVDQAVTWLDDAYGRCAGGTATYQWVRCHALDSLCELAVTHAMPAAPAWLAAFEEQAGRFGMHGFLTRSIEHRDNLLHRLVGTAA